MKQQILINVDGQTYDVADLKKPLPARTFRDAWRFDKGVISVDMDKAKELHRNKMRTARQNKFAELDGMYMKALQTNDKETLELVSKAAEELRNVTSLPAIDKAKTPEQLMKVWPEILGDMPT